MKPNNKASFHRPAVLAVLLETRADCIKRMKHELDWVVVKIAPSTSTMSSLSKPCEGTENKM